jgi:hypothetical protein
MITPPVLRGIKDDTEIALDGGTTFIRQPVKDDVGFEPELDSRV